MSGSMFTTYTTMGYVPVDTSLDQTFTVYGFQLVEGEHLTGATLYEKACLISEQFAQRNGLSVGDDLQVKVPFLAEAEPVALRVQGIFSAPETQYQITGLGNRPEELVFLTPQAMCAVEGREDGREVPTPWAPPGSPRCICPRGGRGQLRTRRAGEDRHPAGVGGALLQPHLGAHPPGVRRDG